jgi:hypothetical protein
VAFSGPRETLWDLLSPKGQILMLPQPVISNEIPTSTSWTVLERCFVHYLPKGRRIIDNFAMVEKKKGLAD